MKKNRFLRIVDDYINENNFSMNYKNSSLDIINYTKIIDFSPAIISIQYKNRVYHIEGENLVISKMMNNEILIVGDIKKITFI